MCYLVKWCHENGQLSFHTKCRKCLECRQERAREWGLRNMLEADEHTTGCFITLTYEDDPVVLVKEHLRDFKKNLRRQLEYYYGVKIKTFDCGEYGDKNLRPHFHILIHGFDFPDKYVERKSDRGHNIYNSPMLEKVWGRGLVTVQDLTMNSAAYCALYAAKPTKFLPEHLQGHPEFNTMSKSLGMKKIMENMEKYLLTDEIFYDGRKYRIPQTALNKYFKWDIWWKKNGHITPGYKRYEELKEQRRLKGEELSDMAVGQFKGASLKRGLLTVYEQKEYRAENRQKRLRREL